jgi:hypothetical protein
MERVVSAASSSLGELEPLHAEAAGNSERASRWILHPWLDPLLLAFPWLPVYLFATLVLDEQQLASPVLDEARLFLLVLFAANFAHRNYTYLLVFGDRRTFGERPRTFIAILAFAFALGVAGSFGLVPGLMPLLLAVIVVWNLQHVVMQRYGFLRVYGRKQGGGTESEAHGRRDLWLLWSLVLLVFSCWLFTDDPRYSYFVARAGALELGRLGPLLMRSFELLPWVGLTVSIPLFAWSTLRWLRHELAASVSLRERLPRWLFLLSSVALYTIAVAHDIFLAFLCVMASHAVEYVAFVHVHCRRRYRGLGWRDGWAVPLLRSSLASFALVGAGGFLLYCVELSAHPTTSGWVGLYITVTVLVHFSFDGLIWREGRSSSRGGAFT